MLPTATATSCGDSGSSGIRYASPSRRTRSEPPSKSDARPLATSLSGVSSVCSARRSPPNRSIDSESARWTSWTSRTIGRLPRVRSRTTDAAIWRNVARSRGLANASPVRARSPSVSGRACSGSQSRAIARSASPRRCRPCPCRMCTEYTPQPRSTAAWRAVSRNRTRSLPSSPIASTIVQVGPSTRCRHRSWCSASRATDAGSCTASRERVENGIPLRCSSAWATRSALGGRSAGALASSCRISSARPASSPGARRAGSVGGVCRWWRASRFGSSASNGRCPVARRNSSTPRLYRSERWSTGLPEICSGDAYAKVPTNSPSCVIRSVASRRAAAPKSRSLMRSSGNTRTFADLRSRCTIDRSCR